VTKNLDHEIET